ncbi:hypothetical protein JCM11491_002281 [Sporobolomyces phaffii]
MTAAPGHPSYPPLPPRIGIEQSLEQLLQSLLELGICASDVQDSALESSPAGVATGQPGGLIGRKATQTIESFARLHSIRDSVQDVMIPLEVIASVDQGKNPHLFTKDFIERLSGENMYTNGILSAVSDYRDLLTEQLKDAFPDLSELLDQQSFAPPPAPGSAPPPPDTNGGHALGVGTNGTHANGGGGVQPHYGAYSGQNGTSAGGESGDVNMEQDPR